MSEDDVICTGAEECKKLEGATHIIHYDGKEIVQRPEYCSGRHPHRFQPEEDGPHVCIFINKPVRGKRIWMRVPKEA